MIRTTSKCMPPLAGVGLCLAALPQAHTAVPVAETEY